MVPKHLPFSLLLLRLSVFLVFLMWTLDKMVQPEHAGRVFEAFYGLHAMGETSLFLIGVLQLVLILLFAAGLMKTWTYGLITLFHGVSTLSSYQQYLQAFDHLLFFAAWPMLAACVSLFLMREHDTLTLDRLLVAAKGLR